MSESKLYQPGDEQLLLKHFAALRPREEQVLRMRLGIGEKRPYTLGEVGERFAVTPGRIRQIEAKALQKLRNAAEKAGGE